MKTVQISDYTSTCWLCGSPARICEKVERDTGLSLVAYCTPAHAPMHRWWKEQTRLWTGSTRTATRRCH